ncbi:MAG TPA: gentisate 1,2-dioxygenase [Novosphingobium sp.]|nr:gentisate 1,2-dioxygenase [Novosphingobium sp.]
MSLGEEQRAALQDLYGQMDPLHLAPLWESLSQLVRPTPRPAVDVHRWEYAQVRDYLMRAGQLISAEQAERRVLILENPAMRGQAAITSSLYAGLQLILPGEIAPCHRHSQCALRFVMEGEGAYTSVDGEKAVMRPFDLVLTPNWQWHDHGNETDQPMIWLDGLDIPIVRLFDATFAEHYDGKVFPQTAQAGVSQAVYGRNLRPIAGSAAAQRPAGQPLFHYPYADWRDALARMAAMATIDPHHAHTLEFQNPADGGSIMPTISAQVTLVPAGYETRPRRQSAGSVLVVVEGQGTARIAGQDVALKPRDLVVVPAWAALELQASSELVLFAYSDKAAQARLGLYREKSE